MLPGILGQSVKCLTSPDIFESAIFFSFHIKKFPRLDVSVLARIQIEFSRPHVSDTNPDSLYYPGLICEYWQQSMRRKPLEICILLSLERIWEQGCHFEYSFHGKELSSILLRHWIITTDLASIRFRIHSVFKSFHFGEWIKKVADSYAVFTRFVWTEAVSGKKKLRIQKHPDSCGRKPYPERKSSRIQKYLRIRVDGSRIRKEKVRGFKNTCRCMWTEAVSGNKKLRIQKYLQIRVDGSRIRKEKGSDSKIPADTCGRGLR